MRAFIQKLLSHLIMTSLIILSPLTEWLILIKINIAHSTWKFILLFRRNLIERDSLLRIPWERLNILVLLRLNFHVFKDDIFEIFDDKIFIKTCIYVFSTSVSTLTVWTSFKQKYIFACWADLKKHPQVLIHTHTRLHIHIDNWLLNFTIHLILYLT